MIRFWARFFDQNQVGFCTESQYLRVLEEVVRGEALKKPSKTTKMFAYIY